jgi:hypothetical protein
MTAKERAEISLMIDARIGAFLRGMNAALGSTDLAVDGLEIFRGDNSPESQQIEKRVEFRGGLSE